MRERTTWNMNEIAQRTAATSRTADPYAMNQDHLKQQPPADKYLTGDPSAFAEDIHPNDWSVEYSGGQVKRNEIGMPEMRSETFTHPEKTASVADEKVLVKKADLCTKVARMMGKGKRFASREAAEAWVEDQSVSLMNLPDADLINTFQRLANEEHFPGGEFPHAAGQQQQAQQDQQQAQQQQMDPMMAQQQQAQQEQQAQQQQMDQMAQQVVQTIQAGDQAKAKLLVQAMVQQAAKVALKKANDQQQAPMQQQGQQQQQAQQDQQSAWYDTSGQQQQQAQGQQPQGQQAQQQQAIESQVQQMVQDAIQAQQQQAPKMANQDQQQQAQQQAQQAQQQQQAQQDQQAQQQAQQAQQQQQAQQDQQAQQQQQGTPVQAHDDQLLDQMLMGPGGDAGGGVSEVDIQLDAAPMDVGEVVLSAEDSILRNLFANQESQDAEEAQQAQQQGGDQQKQAHVVRTAANRTVGTRPNGGVPRIGGNGAPAPKGGGEEVNRLASLWQTAPDVKEAFGLK